MPSNYDPSPSETVKDVFAYGGEIGNKKELSGVADLGATIFSGYVKKEYMCL